MNKQEFTDRTGLTPTDEEYQTIEDLYMATPDMDKDTFCQEYKKHGESRLVQSLRVGIGIQEARNIVLLNKQREAVLLTNRKREYTMKS